MLSSSCLDFGTSCLLVLPVNGDIRVGKRKQYPDSEIGKVSESVGDPFDDFNFIVGALDRAVSVALIFEAMGNLFLVLT